MCSLAVSGSLISSPWPLMTFASLVLRPHRETSPACKQTQPISAAFANHSRLGYAYS